MKPIITFLHFLFLTTFLPSLITAINSLQTQHLLTFKSSIKTPNLLPNWVSENNPCNFTGVSCKNSSISSIDLTNTDLNCDFRLISSNLLTLPFLESFAANNCNLTGVISFGSGFKCSRVLSSLNLGGNWISGSVSDLSEFRVCSELKSVNLSRNLLEFNGRLEPIGISLRVLDLSDNRVSGSGLVLWVVSDGCGSLVEFNVSGSNISGEVPEGLKSCESLQVFDISRNNFSGELPMDTLLKLGSLKTLVLAFNNFAGELPESLSEMSSLEKFDVSSNRISGRIPAGLCGGGGTSRLKVLYLQNNRLNGSIPSNLSNCSELISLDLSFNSLTGEMPSSFRYLSKLQDLIIWMNLLTGEIPEELTYIKALENLILDFNYLTGSIPPSLSNCTNLRWISLSNNRLDGEIPATLGGLPNLAILKLGNNSFSGKIPGKLGDCKSLIWLDLNTNELSGTIPPNLFKQSGRIASGYLTGKPYIYVKNDGSEQCHGSGNLFEFGGIRPDDLDRISSRHLCSSMRLYLGTTQPDFNHNCSMIFLDLSYNKLEGGIPKEVGSMYYLNILNLGHNDFSGPIPEELGGLYSVAILDLSHNKLNRSIPDSLTGLALGDVDLSFNNLSGIIPESAPFDTFPAEAFSNNSGLCGYPLPSCAIDSNVRSNDPKQSNRGVSLVGSVAMGLLFSLVDLYVFLIL